MSVPAALAVTVVGGYLFGIFVSWWFGRDDATRGAATHGDPKAGGGS